MQMSERNFDELIIENSLENLKILIIEDDADSRVMITALLEQFGALVKAVSSSREGLESVQSEKPDIVISDIGLPEEDGYEFMRKFKALSFYDSDRVPAIALTAYAREEDRVQALMAGYQIHMAKPIEPAELVAAIKSLLPSSDFPDVDGVIN
jgi:CheY-like chemotaxis protein